MGDASPSGFSQVDVSLLPSPSPTASVWQTSHPNRISRYRSSSGLPSRATVVIVGSGITAAFAARTLLDASAKQEIPLDLLVLEARETCSGATGRNGGHLQPGMTGKRANLDFRLENFKYLTNLIDAEQIPCELRKVTGCKGYWNKVYFEENKAALESQEEHLEQADRKVTVVEDAVELASLGLRHSKGALVVEPAASLSPYKLVIWLWEDMLERYPSLNLQTETPALELRKESSRWSNVTATPGLELQNEREGWSILTPRGTITAEFVLLATNGYTAHLLPQFRDLITPVQCWMTALRSPAASPFSSALIPCKYGFEGVGPMDRIQDDFLVQRPLSESGQLIFGGARAQVPGNGVGSADDSYVPDRAAVYLKTVLGKLLDLETPLTVDGDHTSQLESDGDWTGILGFSRDQSPWVGRVPEMEGIFLSAGYTGSGMANAGLCGVYVADLILKDMKHGKSSLVGDEGKSTWVMPDNYIITQERIDAAKLSPPFPVPNEQKC